MLPQPKSTRMMQPPSALFLPLAFRFAVSFGLAILQLALPVDAVHPPVRENLYLFLLLAMFSGLVTIDPENRITSANPAAEAILQRPLQPGTPIVDLGLADLTLGETLTKEQRFERHFTNAAGESRIIGGNAAPIRDRGGVQTGYLLLFQDLTDLKALEERTRLSERLATVGELSSELAHELRNPVASILGCVQILQQGEQPKTLMNRILTILQRESERVSAIVSDFLDFSRPRAVRIQSLWFPVLVEEVKASWEMDTRNEGLQLQLDAPPETWIQGDPICVHQVFTNLLSNARKALEGVTQPVVRIRFARGAKGVEVEVVDNGCGMTPEQMQSVFLPFASHFREGTGLGMSLVFQFVQRMGWDIRIESEAGIGTTVHLIMPLGAEPEATIV
jgi:two-component system, NtrC family, sensor histidine kinase PilS